MLINTTSCNISGEDAKKLAEKDRRGLFDIISDALGGRAKNVETLKISQFYYPFYCAGAALRFKRSAGLPTRDMVALAAMECAFGSVTAMQGVPQISRQEAPAREVAEKQFTEEQARHLIGEFLKKRGYRKFKILPEVEIFEFGLVYKPHYVCLCRRGKSEFYRVIDAETGERNYRLDILFKSLKFYADETE